MNSLDEVIEETERFLTSAKLLREKVKLMTKNSENEMVFDDDGITYAVRILRHPALFFSV